MDKIPITRSEETARHEMPFRAGTSDVVFLASDHCTARLF